MNDNATAFLPETGLAGLKAHWRNDLLSGFLVFLIALPLCLGISMASGFPPSAGIITAIIGGMVVSRGSGAFMTINGPAAGLIVVVYDAVQSLGDGDAMAGYRYALAAIVVASVIQILMGVFKAGLLSSFFPASVVHGMLAAIGIIIMAKQIHVMLGVTPEKGSLLSTIAQIPESFANLNLEIAIIGFAGLVILIIWSLLKDGTLKMIPAPLIVVLVGMGLGHYFELEHQHIYLLHPDHPYMQPTHLDSDQVGPKFLVAISENFMSSFYFPNFGKFFTLKFWEAVVAIALVGSLESLLSAMAVDKLDPYKRHSNLNKDLTAVGVGNLIAGSIGGLPMIAEIVRSSANVNNGAKTQWANFFHGSFLLIFVVFFPHLIHSIPLAALASLLVFTGFRLASPREFANVMGIGKEQLFIFVATIISVIATDLLIGVTIGILVKLVIHLMHGAKLNNLFKIHFTQNFQADGSIVINIQGAAVFSNFMALREVLSQIEHGKMLIFDKSAVTLIDHTVMEFLHGFQHDYESQGGLCEFQGLDAHESFSDHPLAARRIKL
ncbi:sulfate transporter [Methylococcaceae bacterium]|nr:sulfate transporter [Methylococcaceae bacterium]